MKEQKSELKKEHILKIAVASFDELGYDKTTLANIAKEAGVSLATIYSFYTNKEEIFLAYLNQDIEKAYENLVEELDFAKTPIEKLGILIDHKFNYFQDRKSNMQELLTKNPMFLVQVGLGEDSSMQLILELIASVFSELDKQMPLVSKDFTQHAYNFKAITNGYIERWAGDDKFILSDKKSEILYLLLKGITK